jgi:chemotaxis protein CheD
MSEVDRRLRRFMPIGGTSPIVRLKPGDVFFDRKPHRLATLLGSCVAVCLWDEERRMGGMTHSVIPTGGKEALHATDASIRELVQRMIRAGCRTTSIRAKLFGGFSPLKGLGMTASIGAANIEIAVAILKDFGIRIVAQEIMGDGGIVIYQDTETGDVSGRLISPIRPGEYP